MPRQITLSAQWLLVEQGIGPFFWLAWEPISADQVSTRARRSTVDSEKGESLHRTHTVQVPAARQSGPGI
ncbi:protein of unknown function (plasmid) [Cupriavidus taiwanensis]|uniref:Uncharacterized protein n=1 Tax=Cupriavidus taiwanensis TaxID=164546 RepID=A0A375HEP5_9BURK|nr:protein of unknown function [Cupriavidus taiwanensis]SOZ72077.1 protein of unknown function [Cupriavidus taiwanensis]SOZ74388.1 protein of unknown function [Cupriavidus taiwanensis]SPA11269.1 protein of unknown function [Cupriavidus taiwanensis]SPD48853.1 protein of unknown function [Cupriavidus taiwanensis]